MFWYQKKVVVTGADGFVGSHLIEYLVRYGARVHVWIRDKNVKRISSSLLPKITISSLDLNRSSDIKKHIGEEQIVFHLAAVVGNVKSNREHPASSFQQNIVPFLNVIDAYRKKHLEKFCIVSSAAIDHSDLSNAYGWAKFTQELVGRWYEKEYGMNIVIVRPFYTYGPRDNFDPHHAHVIPALIRRTLSSENPIVVWGSGNQIRSFIYVKDFARGVLEICERRTSSEPIALGVDEQISIKNLVRLIMKIAGVKKNLVFDPSKPEGKLKSICDTTLLKKTIGFRPSYTLEEGLRKTIEYYKNKILPYEKNI